MQKKYKTHNKCANCGQVRYPNSTLCLDCIWACGGGKHMEEEYMKKNRIKKMAPRVSETAFQFLTDKFQSANFGAELLLGNFQALYLLTLNRELAGKFSAGELKFLIDIYNGTALSSLGQSLTGQVEDSFALYPGVYQEKWGIMQIEIEEKIRALTCFQAACIEIWANAFWYGVDLDKEKDFPEYVNQLV